MSHTDQAIDRVLRRLVRQIILHASEHHSTALSIASEDAERHIRGAKLRVCVIGHGA